MAIEGSNTSSVLSPSTMPKKASELPPISPWKAGILRRFPVVGALAGKFFNLVALACLFVSLVPVNGPLLQRASVVGHRNITDPITLRIPMAQSFPDEFTSSGGYQAVAPTVNFSSVVNDYTNHRQINTIGSGCVGTCTGNLLGAGYSIQCTNSTVPYDYCSDTVATAGHSLTITAFSTNFTYPPVIEGLALNTTSPINFTALVTETGCNGSSLLNTCMLVPAIVEYPLSLGIA